jgi:hypothetical protein
MENKRANFILNFHFKGFRGIRYKHFTVVNYNFTGVEGCKLHGCMYEATVAYHPSQGTLTEEEILVHLT